MPSRNRLSRVRLSVAPGSTPPTCGPPSPPCRGHRCRHERPLRRGHPRCGIQPRRCRRRCDRREANRCLGAVSRRRTTANVECRLVYSAFTDAAVWTRCLRPTCCGSRRSRYISPARRCASGGDVYRTAVADGTVASGDGAAVEQRGVHLCRTLVGSGDAMDTGPCPLPTPHAASRCNQLRRPASLSLKEGLPFRHRPNAEHGAHACRWATSWQRRRSPSPLPRETLPAVGGLESCVPGRYGPYTLDRCARRPCVVGPEAADDGLLLCRSWAVVVAIDVPSGWRERRRRWFLPCCLARKRCWVGGGKWGPTSGRVHTGRALTRAVHGMVGRIGWAVSLRALLAASTTTFFNFCARCTGIFFAGRGSAGPYTTAVSGGVVGALRAASQHVSPHGELESLAGGVWKRW